MPKAQVIHVKGTLKKSLRILRRRGICVAYGHASGPPDPVDIVAELGARGSLYITRPAIWDYLTPRSALLEAADGLFAAIREGVIGSTVARTIPPARRG